MKAETPPQASKARYVQGMFGRIAPRYDLMNRLMTGGQDIAWRKEVIRRAHLPEQGTMLDLGSGTGDLAREAMRQRPHLRVVAGDFTLEMMQVGQQRSTLQPDWSATDALHLPFPDQSFNAVVSGFLLRNVADVSVALSEMFRVLKPGGWMVTLDTTQPKENLLSPFIRFHMRRIIPLLGTVITGQSDAYTYLPVSSENFLPAETLLQKIQAAGFRESGFHRRMFGTVAIHWGKR